MDEVIRMLCSRVLQSIYDLFAVILKQCNGSPSRQRRGQPPVPVPPPANGVQLTEVFAEYFKTALQWTPLGKGDVPSSLWWVYGFYDQKLLAS